ncbi:hypothetical protein [Dyella sp. C9]|uniref:hypothetical protein n=1 Tax=Dyella sp. C9 TaxID=2202154 RepID=UPI001E569F72|nr:hypothetical protein [Dyella sp. C9]
MRSLERMVSFTAFSLLSMSAAAYAEDAAIPPATLSDGTSPYIAVYVAATRVEGVDASDFGQGVDSSTLASMSGGTSVQQNTTLTGTTSNDTANHIYSGDNIISGDSFSGAAGIPVVIQNSGSNVLIQNATVLNVEFKQ